MPNETKENEFKGPTYRYGPNGEAQIFTHSKDVPEGWLDNPALFVKSDEKTADSASFVKPKSEDVDDGPNLPMSKKQIMDTLTEGGVAFKPRASHVALYELLLESLRKALVTAGIDFDPAAHAPALLELLPKPE